MLIGASFEHARAVDRPINPGKSRAGRSPTYLPMLGVSSAAVPCRPQAKDRQHVDTDAAPRFDCASSSPLSIHLTHAYWITSIFCLGSGICDRADVPLRIDLRGAMAN